MPSFASVRSVSSATNPPAFVKYYPLRNSATDPTATNWTTKPASLKFISRKGFVTRRNDPITDMSYMFDSNTTFNDPDISSWDVSSVTNMFAIFTQANAFNQDIRSWNVSSVTNMGNMFVAASAFNQDISSWNVSNVTSMRYMFVAAHAFNYDISSWDVSSVTDMDSMFRENATFDQDLSSWNVTSMALDTTPHNFNFDSPLPTKKFPLFGRDGSQLKYYPMTNSGATDPTGSYWRSNAAPSSATWIGNRGYITDLADPITNMTGMFSNNSFFNDADLQHWDVSAVTTMYGLFQGAQTFNQNISSWNVSNVTSMRSMFWDALQFNQPIGSWNVGNVTNMESMFFGQGQHLRFNQDISNWDVSNVTTMEYMFANGSGTPYDATWEAYIGYPGFDQDLTSWNTSSMPIDTIPSAFSFGNKLSTTPRKFPLFGRDGSQLKYYPMTNSGATDPTDLNWRSNNAPSSATWIAGRGYITDITDPITNMYSMFASNNTFNDPDIVLWNTSTVTNMNAMFSMATAFNQPVGDWDVSSVTDMAYMFNGATSFNQPIGAWDVSSVFNMAAMFSTASSFNQPIGAWDVSSVFNMSAMFSIATAFNQPVGDWDVSSVTNMSFMFDNASAFNQDIGLWDVSLVTDMSFMFQKMSVFNQPIGAWGIKTSSVTSMRSMFDQTPTFNQDISNWDVSSVTDMVSMFSNATAFDQDLRWWDVSHIAAAPTDFSLNTNWTTKPLWGQTFTYYPLTNTATDPTHSAWRSSYAPAGGYRFKPNDGIYTLPGEPITSMHGMFRNNGSFNDPDIRLWDVSTVTSMYVTFIYAGAFNQDIGNWDTSSVNTMYGMFYGLTGFNQDISSWDTGNVTDMAYMFAYGYAFNQDLRWWDVSNIASEPTGFHYYGAGWTTKPLWGQTLNYYPLTNTATDPTYSSWRSNSAPAGGYRFKPNDGIYTLPGEPITNMNSMFQWNSTFNDPDIGSWDTSSVTDMGSMFNNARIFNQDIGGWDTSNVTAMYNMFQNCDFNYDLRGWCVTLITSEPFWFNAGGKLWNIHKPIWGTCP